MTHAERCELIKANIARQLAAAKKNAETSKKRPMQREVFHPMPRKP